MLKGYIFGCVIFFGMLLAGCIYGKHYQNKETHFLFGCVIGFFIVGILCLIFGRG